MLYKFTYNRIILLPTFVAALLPDSHFKPHHGMGQRRRYDLNVALAAVTAVRNGMTIRKASKVFDMSKTTIHEYVTKGIPSGSGKKIFIHPIAKPAD